MLRDLWKRLVDPEGYEREQRYKEAVARQEKRKKEKERQDQNPDYFDFYK
jgi:hypothetical protein